MKTTVELTSLSLILALGACYANTPSTAVSGDTGPIGQPADDAGEGDDDGEHRNGPPPHVFKPRPHPPRHYAQVPPPPDLATLPRLVDRTRQCFGSTVDDRPALARPQPRPSAPSGLAKSKKSASPSTPSSGSAYGQGRSGLEGVGSGAGTGSRGGKGNAADGWGPVGAAPSAPPPPAEAEPGRSPQRESTARKRDARGSRAAERKSESAPMAESSVAVPADHDEEYAGAPALEQPIDRYHDWGASIYLSNDDTMSLSSAQRILHAIDAFLPLPVQHIRPHELLNYFSFDTDPVAPQNDFSVKAEIAEDPSQDGIYSLALAVRGRPMDRETRRNVGLTYVIDRSGSMSAEGRMSYLKRGLQQSLAQLKTGDVVNMVVFDHDVCTPIQNFVVGRDAPHVLERAVRNLSPRGSTDLHSGLREGYRLADAAYRPEYGNRVVLVTDALANTGVTDQEMISLISRYYDSRRIRLSGVGVGHEFNDALLDRLTERGKGAYVFLGSEAEVDAVFGSRFVSLIETVATDVHFQLHLPPSLRMNVFYGEESSVVKEDVQAIHYFANTSQLFLSDLMARDSRIREEDTIMLTIEYEHPETGTEQVEEYAFRLGDIMGETRNVAKGRYIMHFVDGLAAIAARPAPSHYGSHPGSWNDELGFQACGQGRDELDRLSSGLAEDPEVRRVSELWDRYCSRYERPRRPVRRAAEQPDAWPGASGQ